jgi:hypothetical protein
MKPLNPLKFGIAMAITLVGLNAACAVALVVAPDATIALFNSFMHGVDLSRLVPPGGRPVTLTQVLGGMFAIGAVGLLAGSMLAALYNAMQTDGGDEPMTQQSRRSP